jgi:hypothetical protein
MSLLYKIQTQNTTPSQIASRLMVEQGLTQDAADFAANPILLVAERINDQE